MIYSERHAKQQNASFLRRLEKAEKAVKTSAAKSTESVADWQARLNKILKEQGVSEFLTVQVQEKIHTEKRYLRSGRPTATRRSGGKPPQNSPLALNGKRRRFMPINNGWDGGFMSRMPPRRG